MMIDEERCLPTDTEWIHLVTKRWAMLQPQSQLFNQMITDHSKLANRLSKKIKGCLHFASNNPWALANELRAECVVCAIQSIDRKVLQPTPLLMQRDHPIPYQCCLTNEKNKWNEKLQISSCVRVQFIFAPHATIKQSIPFTVDRRMLDFLTIVSFLNHLEEYIDQVLSSLSSSSPPLTPPVEVLYNSSLYEDTRNAFRYIYLLIHKHLIPPSITHIQQSLKNNTTTPPTTKRQKKTHSSK